MGITKSRADQKSVSYNIRNELRNDILSGKIEQGTPLRQVALAQRFNTSRIPVREALRQLEMEGLVKSKLNFGVVVSSPTLSDICDLFDIRVALECQAAKLAVPKMTKEDIAHLENILHAYQLSQTASEKAENNRLFHLALCEPAGNQQLTALIKRYCMSTSSPYANFHIDMTNATNIDAVDSDHFKILNACKQRNADLVVSILELHIYSTRDSLLSYNHQKEHSL